MREKGFAQRTSVGGRVAKGALSTPTTSLPASKLPGPDSSHHLFHSWRQEQKRRKLANQDTIIMPAITDPDRERHTDSAPALPQRERSTDGMPLLPPVAPPRTPLPPPLPAPRTPLPGAFDIHERESSSICEQVQVVAINGSDTEKRFSETGHYQNRIVQAFSNEKMPDNTIKSQAHRLPAAYTITAPQPRVTRLVPLTTSLPETPVPGLEPIQETPVPHDDRMTPAPFIYDHLKTTSNHIKALDTTVHTTFLSQSEVTRQIRHRYVIDQVCFDDQGRPYLQIYCPLRSTEAILKTIQVLCSHYKQLQGSLPHEVVIHWQISLQLLAQGISKVEIQNGTDPSSYLPIISDTVMEDMITVRGESWLC